MSSDLLPIYEFGTVLQHSLRHEVLYLVLCPEPSETEIRVYKALRLDSDSRVPRLQGTVQRIFEATPRDWNVLEVIRAD